MEVALVATKEPAVSWHKRLASSFDQNLLELQRKEDGPPIIFSYNQPGAKIAIEVLEARAERIATPTLNPPPPYVPRPKTSHPMNTSEVHLPLERACSDDLRGLPPSQR
jgi:hypothetical protein